MYEKWRCGNVELEFCNTLSGRMVDWFGWFRLLNAELEKQLKRVPLQVSELDDKSPSCTFDGMEALEIILQYIL